MAVSLTVCSIEENSPSIAEGTLAKGSTPCQVHRLGNLTHMFQILAQQVKDAQEEEDDADQSNKVSF